MQTIEMSYTFYNDQNRDFREKIENVNKNL